jgi:hypothetical protein
MIGYKPLTQSLCKPGVVTGLDIFVDPGGLFGVPTWPQLFESFRHLKHLYISTVDSEQAGLAGLNIENLPPTLTSLQIRLLGIVSDLEKQYSSESFFNVGKLFPNLTRLDLDVHLNDTNAEWVKTFPSSLSRLAVGSWVSDYPLPDSITHLSVYNEVKIVSTVHLPYQLRHLRFFKELKVSSPSADLPLLIASLPSGLEALTLILGTTEFPNTYYSNLPREMTVLDISNRRSSPDINELDLPLSLTEIRMPFPGTLSQVKSLPKTLTQLILDDAPQLPLKDFFAALNPGLRVLMLKNARTNAPDVYEGGLGLPASLTKFDCHFLDLDQAALSSLPPGLVSLSLQHIGSTIQFPIWSSVRSLSAKYLRLMPDVLARITSSLVTLRIWGTRLETDGDAFMKLSSDERREAWMNQFSQFPFQFRYGFEKFDTDTCDYIGDELLAKFPETLTYLSIPSALHVTDIGLQYLRPCFNLTTLDLCKSRITGQAFQFLPETLWFLDASSAVEVFDEHIKHLPRSLGYIFMAGAKLLTDACGPSIPPRVITFRIDKNELITTQIITTLPPLLKGKYGDFGTKTVSFEGGRLIKPEF